MFWVQKKVHWSDTDAAGIAWFVNYFGWFEAAEEELFVATLGQTRQSLLDSLSFGMPRVEARARYCSPVRAGQLIRIGVRCILENPRRLRHEWEMRHDSLSLIAAGHVRVACFNLPDFTPRDLPEQVLRMVELLPGLAEQQDPARLPWV